MITTEYNYTEQDSRKGGRTLTVVIAMRENDSSILMAADGEVLESGMIRLQGEIKLHCHPIGVIAWGTSGNLTIGKDEFGTWLKAYQWPPNSWVTFRDAAVEKLAELNGERRRLKSKAGLRASLDDVADCVIAGWIDGPNIYEFDDSGGYKSYWERGFHVIGSGKDSAWAIYKAFDEIDTIKPLEPLEKLRIIMKVVVSITPKCGEPRHIWRIKQEGITENLE